MIRIDANFMVEAPLMMVSMCFFSMNGFVWLYKTFIGSMSLSQFSRDDTLFSLGIMVSINPFLLTSSCTNMNAHILSQRYTENAFNSLTPSVNTRTLSIDVLALLVLYLATRLYHLHLIWLGFGDTLHSMWDNKI